MVQQVSAEGREKTPGAETGLVDSAKISQLLQFGGRGGGGGMVVQIQSSEREIHHRLNLQSPSPGSLPLTWFLPVLARNLEAALGVLLSAGRLHLPEFPLPLKIMPPGGDHVCDTWTYGQHFIFIP